MSNWTLKARSALRHVASKEWGKRIICLSLIFLLHLQSKYPDSFMRGKPSLAGYNLSDFLRSVSLVFVSIIGITGLRHFLICYLWLTSLFIILTGFSDSESIERNTIKEQLMERAGSRIPRSYLTTAEPESTLGATFCNFFTSLHFLKYFSYFFIWLIITVPIVSMLLLLSTRRAAILDYARNVNLSWWVKKSEIVALFWWLQTFYIVASGHKVVEVVSSYNTTISVLVFACSVLIVADVMMTGFRAFIQGHRERGNLEPELVALIFLLAISSGIPYLEGGAKLDRLNEYMAFCLIATVSCILQILDSPFRFPRALSPEDEERVLFGRIHITLASAIALVWIRLATGEWFGTFGCFCAELLLNGILPLKYPSRVVRSCLETVFFEVFLWKCFWQLEIIGLGAFRPMLVRVFVSCHAQRMPCADDLFCRLRRANSEDLNRFGPVCAICLEEMSSAVVLSCSHVLHGKCLLQWLSARDCCPLCRTKVESESLIVLA